MAAPTDGWYVRLAPVSHVVSYNDKWMVPGVQVEEVDQTLWFPGDCEDLSRQGTE